MGLICNQVMVGSTPTGSSSLREKIMSRSYKKNPFLTICSSYGDKWCRTYYHKIERRKVKEILKNYPNNIDKITSKSQIDYSLKYSDRWSWASDGGNYYSSDLSDIRKNFDEEIFSSKFTEFVFHRYKKQKNIWEQYQTYLENREKGSYNSSKWDNIYFSIVPTTLKTSEELVEWLRENEERMIKLIYRRRYCK